MEVLEEIAGALGLPAWFLLLEADRVPTQIILPPVGDSLQKAKKVFRLPRRYPAVFTAAQGREKYRAKRNKKG